LTAVRRARRRRPRQQAGLLIAPNDDHKVCPGQAQHLSDQHPQFARAEYDDAVAWGHLHGLQHLERRCKRLDEHCRIIVYPIGHDVQIASGKCKVVGERTGMTINAYSRPVTALAWNAAIAEVARAIGDVYLTHHTPPDHVDGAVGYLGDELVSKYSGKTHVSADEFQIGVADAGPTDAQ
jgi:hypothetical protein